MAKVWTVEDTKRMMLGLPPRDETAEGDIVPPDAVSATIETVVEEPLQTTETVEVVEPPKTGVPKGKRRQ